MKKKKNKKGILVGFWVQPPMYKMIDELKKQFRREVTSDMMRVLIEDKYREVCNNANTQN